VLLKSGLAWSLNPLVSLVIKSLRRRRGRLRLGRKGEINRLIYSKNVIETLEGQLYVMDNG